MTDSKLMKPRWMKDKDPSPDELARVFERTNWYYHTDNPLPVAVVCAISADGKSILGFTRKDSGKLALISGFLDRCENGEDAAIREVMEEASVQLHRDDLSKPTVKYGFNHVLLCYTAKCRNEFPSEFSYDTPEGTARWYPIDEIKERDLAFPVHEEFLLEVVESLD